MRRVVWKQNFHMVWRNTTVIVKKTTFEGFQNLFSKIKKKTTGQFLKKKTNQCVFFLTTAKVFQQRS